MNQALVFASIILGVAISDQILSLHRLLRSNAPIRWHWAQPWFALLVLQLNVMIWWGMAAQDSGRITIGTFLPSLVALILLALLTVSTLPDKIPEKGLHLAEYYRANARYQWLLLAGVTAWLTMVGLFAPLENSAFWRLISRMSACLVVTQNGSTPSISALPKGLLARSQA